MVLVKKWKKKAIQKEMAFDETLAKSPLDFCWYFAYKTVVVRTFPQEQLPSFLNAQSFSDESVPAPTKMVYLPAGSFVYAHSTPSNSTMLITKPLVGWCTVDVPRNICYESDLQKKLLYKAQMMLRYQNGERFLAQKESISVCQLCRSVEGHWDSTSFSYKELPIVKAATNGCIGVLKNIVQERPNPLILSIALLRAVQHRQVEAVKFLLENTSVKADDMPYISSKTHVCKHDSGIRGYTALNIAVINGFSTIARLLLEDGADVNIAQPDTRKTPLMLAMAFKQEKIAKMIVKFARKRININLRDSEKKTVLTHAVSRNYTGILSTLLKHAIANQGDEMAIDIEELSSLFTLACEKGHVDCAKILFDATGKSLRTTDPIRTCERLNLRSHQHIDKNQVSIEVKDAGHPLANGTYFPDGLRNGVFRFTRKGVSYGTRFEIYRVSLTWYIARTDTDRELKYYKCSCKSSDRIPPVDGWVRCPEGKDPLPQLVIPEGKCPLLESMMSSAPTHNDWNGCRLMRNGRSPLLTAITNDDYEVVKLLVSLKADVNMCGPLGEQLVFPGEQLVFPSQMRTLYPLNHALEVSQTSDNATAIVELLLKSGADPNLKFETQESPMINAVQNGYLEMIPILASYGADVSSLYDVNRRQLLCDMQTPLMLALKKPYCVDAVTALVAAHADLGTRDFKGQTIYHHIMIDGRDTLPKKAQVLSDNKLKLLSILIKGRRLFHETLNKLMEDYFVPTDIACIIDFLDIKMYDVDDVGNTISQYIPAFSRNAVQKMLQNEGFEKEYWQTFGCVNLLFDL